MTPEQEKSTKLPYPTDRAPDGFAEEVLNLKNFEFDEQDTNQTDV